MYEGLRSLDNVLLRARSPCRTNCRAVRPRASSREDEKIVMSDHDAFERILASLYDAMLDDRHWAVTSALIDEACGLTGNALLVGEGPKDDIRALFVGFYRRGQRHEDMEREYLEVYHPLDERVPRVRQLPDSRLVHVHDVYTAEELKTSRTYNELLSRGHAQDSLNVRLDASRGSYITWSLGDPVASAGWGSSQIAMIKKLLPHIRHFVRVRQALVQAGARATTADALLENPRIGIIHLDRRGQILEMNDRARRRLRHREGLSEGDGVLRAPAAADQHRFEQLLAAALPAGGAVAVSGSMLLRRASGAPLFVVHVKPVAVPQPDYGAQHVAALVLIVEPGAPYRIDPDLVAQTLELTPAETQVAVWLAQGKSVRDMAAAAGCKETTIRWHLRQIFAKHNIPRQAELVRLVLSLAEFE